MFETPAIERFSRIHPATPFVFWLPIFGWVASGSIRGGQPAAAFLAIALLGVFVWSFTEYVLHRFVFHYEGPRAWQRRMHFILHGVHHDFPDDGRRLVMPLGVSVPVGAFFYVVFRLALGPSWAAPLFVGFGLGYLAYDGIHYLIHHAPLESSIGRRLRRHHLLHHHTGERSRWGVSSPLWDWVFGTMGTPRARPPAP